MKSIILAALLVASSIANAELSEKTITGEKAEKLFQALHHSGIQLVKLEGKFATLNEESISCRYTREYEVTEGIFHKSPECFAKAQEGEGFQFDQKLSDTSQLITVLLEVGADADGAMGSFYVSAEKVYCTFTHETRAYLCNISTHY
ncbi:MAG: hypothetical protein NXH75_10715 [Halobacteriovoraceae bacterium]|nr:hypothetical protein [Halobacteriovoraceae bacterium]